MLTKSSPTLLVVLLALLIGGGLIAAKEPAAPKTYDYVAVVLADDELRVSTGATTFDVANTKYTGKYRNYTYNLTALLGKITELEAQGYELVTSNSFAESPGSPRTYALLRRPK